MKNSGLRPWRPGQSGNPGGRPRGRSEVTMLALSNCPKAILKLVAIMEDPNVSAPEQIRAAEAILDRGLGKVVEFPDENRQAFAFFQPMTSEQVAFAEQMVRALPEDTDGDPNSNGSD